MFVVFYFMLFVGIICFFFFSSRRRHTRWTGDWSSDVCSSDLVIWIARQYAHHDVPLLDLIQEGNVALTRAVEKFDPRLGFRLSTYATLSIRGAVERAAERHARVITVPIHVGRLIRAVRRSRAHG